MGGNVSLPSLPCLIRMSADITLGTRKTMSVLVPWDPEQIMGSLLSLCFLIGKMKEMLGVLPAVTTSYPMTFKLLNNPETALPRDPH